MTTGDGALLVAAAGGEFPTLNLAERKSIMDASLAAAQGRVPILASIQHTDTRVTMKLASFAGQVGIAAVQLGHPYYYASTERDVYNLFKLFADNSNVTLMVCHTLSNSMHISHELLIRLTDILSVGAIKWASPDMTLYRDTILAFKDKVAIVDNMGYHVLSHLYGARAFVTHTSGFWPHYPRTLWRQLEAKDYEGAHVTLAAFKYQWEA